MSCYFWLTHVLICSSNPHVAALAVYLMTLYSLFSASMILSKVRNLAKTKLAAGALGAVSKQWAYRGNRS
jgi:hypothetical protein